MRVTFARTLAEMALSDPRIMLLTGDLGYTVLEPFAERHPDRFINVGVAEQNMIGLATGMAEAGLVPFAYSIAPFAVLRPFEFIRNGPVRHGLPVRVVGVGGGFEYGHAGYTHHALEDVGAMRMLPGMTVIAPADFRQAETAIRASADIPGPIYFRLGKDEKREVPGLNGRFEFGRLQTVLEGSHVNILVMGSLIFEALGAVELLNKRGISAGVHVAASIEPAPRTDIRGLLETASPLVTVEAHVGPGGLGSLVAEVALEMPTHCPVRRLFAETDAPSPVSGSEAFLLERHGLSAKGISEMCLTALG